MNLILPQLRGRKRLTFGRRMYSYHPRLVRPVTVADDAYTVGKDIACSPYSRLSLWVNRYPLPSVPSCPYVDPLETSYTSSKSTSPLPSGTLPPTSYLQIYLRIIQLSLSLRTRSPRLSHDLSVSTSLPLHYVSRTSVVL